MKSIIIEKYGDESVLKYTENFEKPKITNANDVLVEIYSASMNPVDVGFRKGNMKLIFTFDLPLSVGFDFSGVVVEVGEKVEKFKIGDEVYSCMVYFY
jgi:alcohol dehydrogenase